MKYLLILYSCCLTACAQSRTGNQTGSEVFDSKYVALLPDTNRMMLIEQVVIRYGDLYAEADSALLEKMQQKVTVYGIRKGSFRGEVLNPQLNRSFIYQKGDQELRWK